MAQRWSDRIAYGVALGLFVGFFVYCSVRGTKKPAAEESAEQHLVHADTYYWFGMGGRGSMAALSAAARHAQTAADKLSEASLSEEEQIRLASRIAGTQADVRYQQELHHDTFHGVFAWSHFMAKQTLFQDVRATGSFELLDQPEVIACRLAVNDLIDSVLAAQTTVAQHDVVFVTDPTDFAPGDDGLSRQLENEALYLFNLNPRFFVHNLLEVATALSPTEQQQLRALTPSEEILRKMRDGWGHRDILVIRLKKMDEVNNHHFWSAQGRLFRGTDPTPAVVYNNYGLCRDRTHMAGAVLAFNVLMLVGSVVLFRFLTALAAHDRAAVSWRTAMGLGTIAFLWGRISVWGLIEIVEVVVPVDETLAVVSFWWPAVTGFVVLLGPGFVMRFAEERFGWLAKTFGTYNRGGALFAAITMGSSAYVGQSALWVRTWGGWSVLPPLLIAAVGAGWIIGRALDPTDSVKSKWAGTMILLAMLIGLAFSHSYPKTEHLIGLWTAASLIALVTGRAVWHAGGLVQHRDAGPAEVAATSLPKSPAELARVVQQPPFRETPSYKAVDQALALWRDGKTVRLQLVGSAGIGKTALLSELQRQVGLSGSVAVMVGVCPKPHEGSEAESYRPFADAIAGHFAVNPLMPAETQLPAIDKAIDGIFEEVVPFSDLLFPPSHHSSGASGSKGELFQSIVMLLRQLARERHAMLIIDDAHWIDEGSAELLERLLEEFRRGVPEPVAIVVASRSEVDGFSEDEVVPLEKMSQEELQKYLREELGFCGTAAESLAEAVAEEDGNMHWLFQMVRYLTAHDVLSWQEGGFDWAQGTTLADHLPDDLLKSVEDMIHRHPDFRPALECAACLGHTFTVDVVSAAMGRSRLECIQLLDRVESETDLIRDLHDQDDTFAFRSSFILEVVRRILGVNAHGPGHPSPQRIREFHSQLATAWESTLEQSTAAVFKIATHRYASGARHAARALDEILVAARAASSQYQHDQARRFVAMARECAAICGKLDDDVEMELLLLECHEAHVEGTNRSGVAEKAYDWLMDHDDAEPALCLTVARACYDAGVDSADQDQFARAVSIAEGVIERGDDPLAVAEAHQFVGISLPPDQAERRTEQLERALEIVTSADDSVAGRKLKSRILNSLAEQLSHGGDRDRARQLFLDSIHLKKQKQIRDTHGLAFAYGGLGRLAYFAPEPDYDTARKHFEKDLMYSRRISSRVGQAKMLSMLGGCDLAQERFEEAADQYSQAARLSDSAVDRYFALAGLLECSGALGRADQAADTAEQLLSAIDQAESEAAGGSDAATVVPRYCAEAIRAAMKRCDSSAAWYGQLLGRIGPSETPAD